MLGYPLADIQWLYFRTHESLFPREHPPHVLKYKRGADDLIYPFFSSALSSMISISPFALHASSPALVSSFTIRRYSVSAPK